MSDTIKIRAYSPGDATESLQKSLKEEQQKSLDLSKKLLGLEAGQKESSELSRKVAELEKMIECLQKDIKEEQKKSLDLEAEKNSLIDALEKIAGFSVAATHKRSAP